jgi:alcohol dehydrogenase class IV
MGLADTRPDAFIAELEAIKSELGIPASLTHYGVTREALPDLARHAVEIRTLMDPNPVAVDEATAIKIYESCL